MHILLVHESMRREDVGVLILVSLLTLGVVARVAGDLECGRLQEYVLGGNDVIGVRNDKGIKTTSRSYNGVR